MDAGCGLGAHMTDAARSRMIAAPVEDRPRSRTRTESAGAGSSPDRLFPRVAHAPAGSEFGSLAIGFAREPS